MACQLIDSFMISQTNIAIFTLRYPPTSTALDHRSKSTPVLKQDYLFFLIQCFTYILNKQGRKLTDHPLLTMQFLYIDRKNLRQSDFLIPLFQFNQPVFSVSSIVPGFHRRRSSSQQNLRPIHSCQHNSSITGMIARCRILLFIRIFMFFVHNHQTKITKRQKNRRTYSQYYIVSFISQLFLPYLHPFSIWKLRMVDSQSSAEHPS